MLPAWSEKLVNKEVCARPDQMHRRWTHLYSQPNTPTCFPILFGSQIPDFIRLLWTSQIECFFLNTFVAFLNFRFFGFFSTPRACLPNLVQHQGPPRHFELLATLHWLMSGSAFLRISVSGSLEKNQWTSFTQAASLKLEWKASNLTILEPDDIQWNNNKNEGKPKLKNAKGLAWNAAKWKAKALKGQHQDDGTSPKCAKRLKNIRNCPKSVDIFRSCPHSAIFLI